MKGIFLHFDLGYSYYSDASVQEPDLRPAAGDGVARDRGVGDHLARRRAAGRDRLGACAGARGSTARAMGTALVLVSAPEYWLGLIVLYLFAADIGRVKVFPGAGSYVALTQRPVEMVHLADPALARASPPASPRSTRG